ncbi:MAG TPA: hypothetical protein PLD19_02110, partial [Luteimonas sp.]|nr:hypothetical protein [Luteimonas sp.]
MTVSPLPAGFSPTIDGARPLHVLDKAGFGAWMEAQTTATRDWLQSQQFSAAPGSHALLPGEGGVAGAVLGIGDPLDAYSYAHAAAALPEGDWMIANALQPAHASALQLGWGLGAYRFTRYKNGGRAPARLAVVHDELDLPFGPARVDRAAHGV